MIQECEAVKRKYDHKADKDKCTPAKRWLILRILSVQYTAAMDNRPIKCAGVRIHKGNDIPQKCKNRLILLKMYRCWFCGLYFCPACSRVHFGDKYT